MKKLYPYNKNIHSKLSRVLQDKFSGQQFSQLDTASKEFSSQLALEYNFKSIAPISFKFDMRIKLTEVKKSSVLNICVRTQKFYFLAVGLIAFLSFIAYEVYSFTWLNLLWLLPVLVLRSIFQFQINEELDLFVKRLMKETAN